MQTEKLRLDKYLWAIRLFKTRSIATEACNKDKVKFNGNIAKASKNVSVGDEYEVKTEVKKWLIKITQLLHNRVQFSIVVNYYLDITPEEEMEKIKLQTAFFTGKRMSKTGKPTKKNKRDIDKMFDL